MAECPTCKKEAAPRATNPNAPFCSLRCKQIDLGNWLDEKYRVPTDDGSADPESGTSPNGEN